MASTRPYRITAGGDLVEWPADMAPAESQLHLSKVGMIGNEGMFSVSVVLGDDKPLQRAIVQLAGSALRMPSAVQRQEADANAALRAPLLRYAQMVLTTATQTAACDRLHLLEQRCARWLLSALDRAEEEYGGQALPWRLKACNPVD
jgi:hypothetical protein